MGLKELIDGRIIKHNRGELLLSEASFYDIGKNFVRRIEQHKDGLNGESIYDKFPLIKDVPRSKMLFFDIETYGVKKEAQICSISYATISPKMNSVCLFARGPNEESTIINYFFDLIPYYKAFFTYNGTSFDLSRLSNRAKSNGTLVNGYKNGHLKEIIENRHIDLYRDFALHEWKPLAHDLKLSTVEKVILKVFRENDIPGSKVPGVYHNYLYESGDENIEEVKRLISHNMLDTVSLVAILAMACSNK